MDRNELTEVNVACGLLCKHLGRTPLGYRDANTVKATLFTRAVLAERRPYFESWMVGPLRDTHTEATAELRLWLAYTRLIVVDKVYAELLVQDREGGSLNAEAAGAERYKERKIYG